LLLVFNLLGRLHKSTWAGWFERRREEEANLNAMLGPRLTLVKIDLPMIG